MAVTTVRATSVGCVEGAALLVGEARCLDCVSAVDVRSYSPVNDRASLPTRLVDARVREVHFIVSTN